MKTILLLDDDDTYRTRLSKALMKRNYKVCEAPSISEALELTSKYKFEYAIIDLFVPDGSGMELLQQLLAKDPDVRAVVLTGFGTIGTAVEATKLGAVQYLTKPTNIEDILHSLTGESLEPPMLKQPTLAQVEWEHMQRVLKENDGNISKTAKALGLHRRSLQRKLGKVPQKLS